MDKNQQGQQPYCFHCCHFYITHESATPYGCRAIGFKSAQNPAMVVLKNSGLQCQMFSAKLQKLTNPPKPPRSWLV